MLSRITPEKTKETALDLLQKASLTLMAVLIMITFAATNLQAILWQSSHWLVSTVLPAVVVELTNEERSDNAVQPLKRNATLDAAAKMKAEHMAKNEYFAHFAPDGTSPWYWFKQAGYSYAHAGENLAIHFTDSAEVVEAWMNSPTHRENIVNGKYTEIGVGTAKGKFDGHNTVYVVQLFGTPAASPVAATPKPALAASNPVSVPTPVPAPARVAIAVPDDEAVLAAETPEEPAVEEVVESTEAEVSVVEESAPDSTESVVRTPEPLPVATPAESLVTEETMLLQSSMISTSSGLAVASATDSVVTESATLAGFATRPNAVLQILYIVLGTTVVSLLLASIVLEVRRRHVTQVIYGIGLLIIMTGLWFFHSYITSGAVIM